MNRSVIRKAVVLAGTLMWAAAILPEPARAAEDTEVSVWMPSFAQAPATVQLNVRVAPRKENRLLRVTLDSDAYYRSSDLPLDGAEAATMHSIRWPGIPSGEYVVVVELFQSNGKRHSVYGGRLDILGIRR